MRGGWVNDDRNSQVPYTNATNMQRKFLSMKKVNIYISHYFIERATADPHICQSPKKFYSTILK